MIEVMVRPVLADGRGVDWKPMGLSLVGADAGGLRLALTGRAKWFLDGRGVWEVTGWEMTFTDGNGVWASTVEEIEQRPSYSGTTDLVLEGEVASRRAVG